MKETIKQIKEQLDRIERLAKQQAGYCDTCNERKSMDYGITLNGTCIECQNKVLCRKCGDEVRNADPKDEILCGNCASA